MSKIPTAPVVDAIPNIPNRLKIKFPWQDIENIEKAMSMVLMDKWLGRIPWGKWGLLVASPSPGPEAQK